MSRLVPLSGVLQQVLRQYGLEHKFLEHRMTEAWEEVVGKTIAAHTLPETVRFKKLILRVDSSVWMQQLTFYKKEMIQKINESFPTLKIEEIHFRVGVIDKANKTGELDPERG
jgi:predicted nucleic acid-binding Zn ribbon protein